MASSTTHSPRIHYEVEGRGEPLVLHHGHADSLDAWREAGYADRLARTHLLILVDARGHGGSEKPHDPDAYSLERRAADVVAVLDDLGLPAAHYCGYSLGGWVGLGLARDHPARFRSFAIGGAQPYGQSMEPYRAILRGGMTAWIGVLEEMAGPLPPATAARLRRNDVAALRASFARDRPDISAALPAVAVPCLLFAGEADPLAPLVRRCAEELPRATFRALPGLNHIATFRRSDLLLPRLTRFLAEAGAGWPKPARGATSHGRPSPQLAGRPLTV
jgi:pimeloyl-ACP methyl ester carboxylesterase